MDIPIRLFGVDTFGESLGTAPAEIRTEQAAHRINMRDTAVAFVLQIQP